MIIATAFSTGFQNTISKKIFSFWGHIRVQHAEEGKAAIAEETVINKSDTIENILKQNKHVICINSFATKSAILDFNKQIEGVLIKGVDKNYDSMQLKPYLQNGRWLAYNDSGYSREIILSAHTAQQINAKQGDTIKTVFINQTDNTSTYRKLIVAAIFKTGVEENDTHFAIADIKLIQTINNWNSHQIGGYEVFISDYKNIDVATDEIRLPIVWQAKSLKEVYPSVFDWLQTQDTNRNIVFIIMSIVAMVNLITCLLILVLERIKMVGVLKAVGLSNARLQSIFLYYASIISLGGIGIGFIAGIGLCLLQQQTHFISMDEENYYVAYAPVEIVWWQVSVIGATTFAVCFLALILPTLLVKKIQPIKAIRF